MNIPSQFLTDPRHVNLVAAKNVLRYLKGTVEYGLNYDGNQKINLHGYVDSDWLGRATDRKSTLGGYFSLGSNRISWFSRKQLSVALSTTEAEYIAAYSASCAAVWLIKLLSDLFDLELEETCILCDN